MTLTLSVTFKKMDDVGNYVYNFSAHSSDLLDTCNVYVSIDGADYEFLFTIPLHDGAGSQEYDLGAHLEGKPLIFWAGLPGVIDSNKVTVTLGEGGGGISFKPCFCVMLHTPKKFNTFVKANIRAYLPKFLIGWYYLSSKAVFEIFQ